MVKRDTKSSGSSRKRRSSRGRMSLRVRKVKGPERIDQLKEKINDTDYVSVAINKIAADLAREFY